MRGSDFRILIRTDRGTCYATSPTETMARYMAAQLSHSPEILRIEIHEMRGEIIRKTVIIYGEEGGA